MVMTLVFGVYSLEDHGLFVEILWTGGVEGLGLLDPALNPQESLADPVAEIHPPPPHKHVFTPGRTIFHAEALNPKALCPAWNLLGFGAWDFIVGLREPRSKATVLRFGLSPSSRPKHTVRNFPVGRIFSTYLESISMLPQQLLLILACHRLQGLGV